MSLNIQTRSLLPTLALALLLPGCITLNHQSIDHPFDGLRSAMARSGTVSMLLVHGMGGYSVGDPQTLIDAVQKTLQLRSLTATSNQAVIDKDIGSLDRQDFVSPSGHSLRVYVLTWEPLTENVKKHYLSYDGSIQSTRYRLPLLNDVKQSLMDDNVPDVVLYVGDYKAVLQRAVTSALKQMQRDLGDNKDYEYFFVTFSLGSKIVFDVVDELDKEADGAKREEIVDKTASFFMLANQLPLLGLGSLTGELPATRPANPGYESMLQFVRRKHHRRSSTTVPATATQPAGGELSIVAVSDPNDLFSYAIPPVVEQQFPATFVNVSLNVAKTGYWIPTEGYVINPMVAHTGYGHDPDVIKLLIEGWKHGR